MRDLTVLQDFNPFGDSLPSSLAAFDPEPAAIPVVVAVPGQYSSLPFVPELLMCTACPARREALQVVPGAGPIDAVAMVIGQNPGEDEDRAGVPFVGAGGDLLDVWLKTLGLARQKLVITNLVKCHTTGNRVPKATEQRTCFTNWLTKELESLTHLQVLFPVGKPAVSAILGKAAPPMTPLLAHHYVIRIKGTSGGAGFARELHVFPLPHPAFLLRARHLGPLMQTVLSHVRMTLEQELPATYSLLKR